MNFAQLMVVTSAALLTVSARMPSQLERRDNFTGPPCESSFQWLDGGKNKSPCVLAAATYGSCAGTNWTIDPLAPGDHYDPPVVGFNVTQCSCSWVAYNLISACTVCQGVEASVLNWPAYSVNCAGETSNQFFPSNQVLPEGIPSYAKNDPTTWPEERFDVSQAQAIVNQDNSTSSHSSHVGAIVGGVVGGFAVIVLAGGLAFYLYRKKQKQIQASAGNDGSKHARKMSDLSQKSGIGYGYQQLEPSFAMSSSSQPPVSPTTGTMHTHTASANSLSYFGSVRHSVIPHGTSVSPSPAARAIPPVLVSPSHPPNSQGLNREEIIVPFTLPPSNTTSHQGSSVNLSDRKRADGAIIPVYDPPNSLPTTAIPMDTLSQTSTSRARVNPPAYSALDDISIAPSRAVHSKKGSGDTQFSIDSKTGGPTSAVQRHGASVSGIDDMIGQMGFSGQESVSGGGTLSTGQSGQLLGAQQFRPVLGNPDP
ncbi:hypothetical protein H2248_000195 [Termitomyces sp. 'cryptogamus']|nr:hypothetical protein H2248_000195 [Termitomyces sp. 'cryptogamus']